MGRTLALILLAVTALAACGVDGAPEADSRIDLTEFWQEGR